MRVHIPKASIAVLALLGMGSFGALAGHFEHNFDTDPADVLVLRGTAKWRATGGNGPDPLQSGYLSITDALNGQSGKIVFDDFDNGAVVAGFSFKCDLRTGGGTGSPALVISARFAPFPPSRSFIVVFPSACPFANVYTYFFDIVSFRLLPKNMAKNRQQVGKKSEFAYGQSSERIKNAGARNRA